jgi:hypothetical protein
MSRPTHPVGCPTMLLRSVSSRIWRPHHTLRTHSRRSTLGGSGEIYRVRGRSAALGVTRAEKLARRQGASAHEGRAMSVQSKGGHLPAAPHGGARPLRSTGRAASTALQRSDAPPSQTHRTHLCRAAAGRVVPRKASHARMPPQPPPFTAQRAHGPRA